MRYIAVIYACVNLAHFCGLALGHEEANAIKADPEDSWQVRHMKEEHMIDSFDVDSFFTLHDSDGSNTWTGNDILNLYGLLHNEVVGDGTGMGDHGESKQVSEETKQTVLHTILELIDHNNNGIITLEEWREFSNQGKLLPDFGFGPGHHGDYEYEYEIHHWLKYHADQDPDVNIVHPEDEEHEKLYHAHEGHDHEEPGQKPVQLEGNIINLNNIPSKFRT